MTWLWTDALADLLIEHDRVERARVAAWVERPEAYPAPESGEPIDLARDLLRRHDPEGPQRAFAGG